MGKLFVKLKKITGDACHLPPFVTAVLTVAFLLVAGKAEAIPAFAKKYSAPCTLCHGNWPELNAVGWRYKLNGYQLEEGRDGAETGKSSPSFDLHLDAGKANPPISLRLDGGVEVLYPKFTPQGEQANNFPCCVNGNRFRAYAAGTLDQDIGYFVSYRFGDTQMDRGYIRFANILGAGYIGIDLGAINTADSDAVAPDREWFGTPNPAFFGTADLRTSDQGMSAGYSETGARIFGNPDNGPFSYDLLIASSSRDTGSAVNSRGTAYSAMMRMDRGKFSGSFRYYNSTSAELAFSRPAGAPFYGSLVGQTSSLPTDFAPSRLTPDETTLDYIFSFSYDDERWKTEFVYLWNDFSLGTRTNAAGSTYTRDNVRRTGASLAWLYRFSSRVAAGARYGYSAVPGYNEYYNATGTNVPGATAQQIEFKVEALPVQNARISLQWTIDLSNDMARTDLYGNVYSLQNKVFLLWDWAI